MEDRLEKYLESLSVPESGGKSRLLKRYTDEILLFNPALKLVGTNDREDLVLRHIMDSASAYPVFLEETEDGDDIADLGSGAGLPGIVLAALLPGRNFYLIERMQRRVGFLRTVSALLKLDNVKVIDRDIKDAGRSFDCVTCRAFHPLYDIARDVARLSKKMVLYKGTAEVVTKELNALSSGGYSFSSEVIPVRIPGLDEERNIVVLKDLDRK